jgi:hypothetical protein
MPTLTAKRTPKAAADAQFTVSAGFVWQPPNSPTPWAPRVGTTWPASHPGISALVKAGKVGSLIVEAPADEPTLAAARQAALEVTYPEPTNATGGYVEEKQWRCIEQVSWSDGYAARQTSTGGAFEREVYDDRTGTYEIVKDVAPGGSVINAVVRQVFVGDVISGTAGEAIVKRFPKAFVKIEKEESNG